MSHSRYLLCAALAVAGCDAFASDRPYAITPLPGVGLVITLAGDANGPIVLAESGEILRWVDAVQNWRLMANSPKASRLYVGYDRRIYAVSDDPADAGLYRVSGPTSWERLFDPPPDGQMDVPFIDASGDVHTLAGGTGTVWVHHAATSTWEAQPAGTQMPVPFLLSIDGDPGSQRWLIDYLDPAGTSHHGEGPCSLAAFGPHCVLGVSRPPVFCGNGDPVFFSSEAGLLRYRASANTVERKLSRFTNSVTWAIDDETVLLGIREFYGAPTKVVAYFPSDPEASVFSPGSVDGPADLYKTLAGEIYLVGAGVGGGVYRVRQ